ncbi:RIP metalloprotease RseP [Pseudoroseicyclus aestuarii]|uniref:Zinc metalloprotease n=1 Tax=Pseudoroseicyclus aestuarii TaxID=1795041 RepID=A0A318SY09_9RHOB|nr:RIP metalloprotease RseP [Pseudoroseicyclus aestuarii]PYE86215.1 regulator of sigma E protease [Pseudoroseicyclus aestuarii]
MDFSQLLPQFGNLAFTLVAFIVALSVIVAVHEFGHYIVGRWCGIRAEVFSLGFGPVIASRMDRRGTRWQLAALPFGGYVKFSGDSNVASVGGIELSDIEGGHRRETMLGAPLWARAATVAAGPVFNFILSILIFTGIMMSQGQPATPLTIAALKPLPQTYDVELEPGDEILAVAGQPVAEEGLVFTGDYPDSPVVDYTIRRAGAEQVVTGPYPALPLAGSISPGSPAYAAGLRSGDVIQSLDGEPIHAFEQIVEAVTASEGAPMQLGIWRDGESFSVDLAARSTDMPRAGGGFETRWLLGIGSGSFFEAASEPLPPLEALSLAVSQLWMIVSSSISGLGHMLTGAISSCNLSGPVGIAETSGAMASQGASSFIWFVAVLSTAVGLLNLFPVPVLDGGHLVFHAWEAVTGHPPSEKALQVLMSVGLALILTMTVFAVMNDLFLCP